MPAAVLKGSKHPLFTTLGIPYILIVFEGERNKLIIYDTEQGRQALRSCVENKLVTIQEMMELEAQIVEKGVFDCMEVVLEQVKRFPLQKDIPPRVSIASCRECVGVGRHMHLVDQENNQITDPITTFEECFDLAWNFVGEGKMHLYDGICLLQKSAAAVTGKLLSVTKRARLAPRTSAVGQAAAEN